MDAPLTVANLIAKHKPQPSAPLTIMPETPKPKPALTPDEIASAQQVYKPTSAPQGTPPAPVGKSSGWGAT